MTTAAYPPGACTCNQHPHTRNCCLITCPACGSYVGRWQANRGWMCDRGHWIYRSEGS